MPLSRPPIRGPRRRRRGPGALVATRAALVRAQAALAAETGLRDELLARLSHDLRTPMGAVLGWAKALLMKGSDADATRRGLEAIVRNAALEARLVDEMLDASRLLSGTLHLDCEPLDPAPLVAAEVETARGSAAAKRVGLQAEIDAEAGAVSGDPVRLRRIVTTLLANALKHTPPGGGIEVHLRRDADSVVLDVKDTGAGLAAEALPGLLEPSAAGAAPAVRAHKGLGLAQTRALVELHGGTIEAMSAGPGRGTTMSVRLPRRSPGEPSS